MNLLDDIEARQGELDFDEDLSNKIGAQGCNSSFVNPDFGDEFDAEAFMKKSLPDRFHAYMVREICSEENYQEAMRNNGYDYLPMLYKIKRELPGEFYTYFHDLLHEKEHDFYYNKFLQSLKGII